MIRQSPGPETPHWRRQGSGSRRAPDTRTRARPCVLIVDDDDDTRDMYAWCMRAGGWFVEAVADGAEALVVAPLLEPDVIVMDLRLPVLGGLEAIRRLKSEEDTKHIPIVAISGVDRNDGEIEAKAAGCDEFVAKPCHPETLRKLVETLAAR
jgi:two-component system cell cycle response regulator DivK